MKQVFYYRIKLINLALPKLKYIASVDDLKETSSFPHKFGQHGSRVLKAIYYYFFKFRYSLIRAPLVPLYRQLDIPLSAIFFQH